VGRDPTAILAAAARALDWTPAHYAPPEMWDGHAAERIVRVLVDGQAE